MGNVDEWESKHVIRAPDPLWDAFGDSCAAEGTNRSAKLRAFMAWHARFHPKAKMPRRPPPPDE